MVKAHRSKKVEDSNIAKHLRNLANSLLNALKKHILMIRSMKTDIMQNAIGYHSLVPQYMISKYEAWDDYDRVVLLLK